MLFKIFPPLSFIFLITLSLITSLCISNTIFFLKIFIDSLIFLLTFIFNISSSIKFSLFFLLHSNISLKSFVVIISHPKILAFLNLLPGFSPTIKISHFLVTILSTLAPACLASLISSLLTKNPLPVNTIFLPSKTSLAALKSNVL